jgi:NAD(P)-dependent dehydrogenase (short-subunit alcohol dehydrogenase family)
LQSSTEHDREFAIGRLPFLCSLVLSPAASYAYFLEHALNDSQGLWGSAERSLRTSDKFGATCAFLCSVQASYITGQNLVIDGGAYPGTF